MKDKLDRFRLEQANTQENNRYLDSRFTDAEHEFISEQVINYNSESNRGVIIFQNKVTGEYPNRRYTGHITRGFIQKFFS